VSASGDVVIQASEFVDNYIEVIAKGDFRTRGTRSLITCFSLAGAGAFCEKCTLILTRTLFRNNSVLDQTYGDAKGAGMAILGATSTFENCTFEEIRILSANGTATGGAFYMASGL